MREKKSNKNEYKNEENYDWLIKITERLAKAKEDDEKNNNNNNNKNKLFTKC